MPRKFIKYAVGSLAIAIAIATAIANSASIQAEEPVDSMTTEQVKALMKSVKFKQIQHKTEIPKEYSVTLSLDAMSDAGGKFDSGCTGEDPHSRFIAGALGGPYLAIFHEYGGRAYQKLFELYKNEHGTIKNLYRQSVVSNDKLDEFEKLVGINVELPRVR